MALKVLGIAGSLRAGSYNRALLRAAQELAPAGMEITTFDLAPIPLYNGDVEAKGDPEPVAALKAAIRQADALLIVTPAGGCSSAWLERQVVALEVAGSNPVTHPSF